MTTQTDPRVSQALNLIATVGGLLARAERVLRTAAPGAVARVDLVLRGLLQANHSLSLAWNAALADVPEQKAEQPKTEPREPSPFFREITSRGCDTPEAHALREKEARAAAAERDVRRALPEGPLEWHSR